METMQTVIGESHALNTALDHISNLAGIDRSILVTGERGTGKEIAANRLHFLSSRWQGPFIKLNCASLPENLLDSELFGYEPGAFTGARRSHQGRFERADGGTLFLDELGTMPIALQEKLLRVIEYGELERIGGSQTIKVDVRVVAATNADLPVMAAKGEFRWDLLDRLTFDVVNMPPLRARERDIALLAEHFAVRFAAESGWNHSRDFRQALEASCIATSGRATFVNLETSSSVRCTDKVKMESKLLTLSSTPGHLDRPSYLNHRFQKLRQPTR